MTDYSTDVEWPVVLRGEPRFWQQTKTSWRNRLIFFDPDSDLLSPSNLPKICLISRIKIYPAYFLYALFKVALPILVFIWELFPLVGGDYPPNCTECCAIYFERNCGLFRVLSIPSQIKYFCSILSSQKITIPPSR